MKDSHFKLSASFKNHLAKHQPRAANQQGQPEQMPNRSLGHGQKNNSRDKNRQPGNLNKSFDHSGFVLNPKSAQTLNDVPIKMLRNKSKNKLESLKDEGLDKNKFSIFTSKVQQKREPEPFQQKKMYTKKYNIDTGKGDQEKSLKAQTNAQQPDLPADIVRPSQLPHHRIHSQNVGNASVKVPCLFQTPILPCFASEFRSSIGNLDLQCQYKCVQQKEGVWKIGKIRVKKGEKNPTNAKLQIGGIKFSAVRAQVAGKTGVVSQEYFYQLPNWKGIWVVQPEEELFR